MTDKNQVSQAAMDELNLSKYEVNMYKDKNIFTLLKDIPEGCALGKWIWHDSDNNVPREQAIIDYVFNDADNFEVKIPTWVLISKEDDGFGDWYYLKKEDDFIDVWSNNFSGIKERATKRATRITDPKLKDALLYANPDFEAIEVEE